MKLSFGHIFLATCQFSFYFDSSETTRHMGSMKLWGKPMLLIPAIVLFVLILAPVVILNLPEFGALPSGERLERIRRSPNYKNGAFQNLRETPMLTGDASFPAMLIEFLFKKKERLSPGTTIPSKKTDLLSLDPDEDVLVWFGHSSYWIQSGGVRLLVDPVFSGSAGPLSLGVKAFPGTDIYTPDDFPEIDFLVITHDHWDHLDYRTVQAMKGKIGTVIAPLGVGSHLESWGWDPQSIVELDWNETFEGKPSFRFTALPARHFSGRGIIRNKTLWAAFLVETGNRKIFIGGDGGYDTHFLEIGEKYGPLDLAILENGQYDNRWKFVHLLPEEWIQAANDLKAKHLFPVHSGKFILSSHPWDDPLERLWKNRDRVHGQLVTPMIGERVGLDFNQTGTGPWWRNVDPI